jgi:hypothetical protein
MYVEDFRGVHRHSTKRQDTYIGCTDTSAPIVVLVVVVVVVEVAASLHKTFCQFLLRFSKYSVAMQLLVYTDRASVSIAISSFSSVC